MKNIDFKENNNLYQKNTDINYYDLKNTIVQYKLREKFLTYSEYAICY